MAIVCKCRLETVTDPLQTLNELNLHFVWWLEKDDGTKVSKDFEQTFNVSDVNKAAIDAILAKIKAQAEKLRDFAIAAKKLDDHIGEEWTIQL